MFGDPTKSHTESGLTTLLVEDDAESLLLTATHAAYQIVEA
jgi:hypothetical protein